MMVQPLPIRKKKKTGVSTSNGEVLGPPTLVTPSRRSKANHNSAAGSSARPQSIDDFAPPKEKKPRKKSYVSPKSIQTLKWEMDKMRVENDWEHFKAGHWVALYAALHERVYGFYPTELESGTGYAEARPSAARLLKTVFRGNAEMMADFIRWTWVREKGYEDWRRANNQSGKRIGWRLQFSATMVSDYRLDRTRKS